MQRVLLISILIATALAGAAYAAAPPANLVANPGFEDGLDGWTPNAAPGAARTVSGNPASGAKCLEIRGNGTRAGMTAGDIALPEPHPNTINVSFRARREAGDAGARVGITLGITFSDGGQTWYSPGSALLAPGDREWQLQGFRYLAPEGKTVAAIRPVLINYQNSGIAWFDDISVTASYLEAKSVVAAVLTPPAALSPLGGEIAEALNDAGISAASVPTLTSALSPRIAIVPRWWDDDDLYYQLRLHHFRGGTVLVGGPGTPMLSKALKYLFWPDEPEGEPGRFLLSPDGRTAYRGEGVNQKTEGLVETVSKLLATDAGEIQVPEAIDFGPRTSPVIRDGCVWIGDEPFLLRAPGMYRLIWRDAVSDYKADLARWADSGLNAVSIYVPYDIDTQLLQDFLNCANSYGVRVIVEQGGVPHTGLTDKPMRLEWLARLTALRKHPALLGWVICDDTFDRHMDFVGPSAQFLRRADPDSLITTTLMDPRHPERVPPERWEQWRRLIDFPLTYLYPLQKQDQTYPYKGDIEGGLADVCLLSANTRSVFGEQPCEMQWIQAHMQGPAYPTTGLTLEETYVPTNWQQRLLVYLGLIGGTKGQLYFHARALNEEMGGENRLRELALVWHELGPVDDIIAAGERHTLSTGDPDVTGSAFVRDGEAVILLAKNRRHYNRYVSDSSAGPLEIALPEGISVNARAIWLPWDAGEVSCAEGKLAVPAFDLTAAVLVSADSGRCDQVAAELEQWKPQAAELARQILADDLRQTEAVTKLIDGAMGDARGKQFADAKQSCLGELDATRGPAEAYARCREAARKLREFRAACIADAADYAAANPQPREVLYSANVFYSLPVFYSKAGAIGAYEKGQLRRDVDALKSLGLAKP